MKMILLLWSQKRVFEVCFPEEWFSLCLSVWWRYSKETTSSTSQSAAAAAEPAPEPAPAPEPVRSPEPAARSTPGPAPAPTPGELPDGPDETLRASSDCPPLRPPIISVFYPPVPRFTGVSVDIASPVVPLKIPGLISNIFLRIRAELQHGKGLLFCKIRNVPPSLFRRRAAVQRNDISCIICEDRIFLLLSIRDLQFAVLLTTLRTQKR